MTTLAMGAGMLPIAMGWARPTQLSLAHGGGGDWRADHLHRAEPAGDSGGVHAIAMAGIVLGTRHFLPNWLAAINIYALYAALFIAM
jgi:hypothetical protein